jgi:hypothetical protein
VCTMAAPEMALGSASGRASLPQTFRQERNMSNEKQFDPNASADELAKPKKPGDVQLSEEDLSKVTGGAASDIFMKIDNIKGESQDE